MSTVKITKIKVTADKAICGQFDFNDNGIDVDNSRPYTTEQNKNIELKLSNSETDGFPIPYSTTPNYNSNAAIMVIAPGTYTTLLVEYTLYVPSKNSSVTMTKTYNNVTLIAGKNKKIIPNLQVPVFAANHRAGGGGPNIHEVLWYLAKGKPQWDSKQPWICNGALYVGGVWIKKQKVIANENGKTLYQILTTDPEGTSSSNQGGYEVWLSQKTTANDRDYFFLPPLGNYYWTDPYTWYNLGTEGHYWTSSGHPRGPSHVWGMQFTSSSIKTSSYNYGNKLIIWSAQ